MCRFFAVTSTRPVPLAPPLAALARQSICDCRGEKHEHGWGIATHEIALPTVRRSLQPAHADPQFAAAAQTLASRLAIAHIRQASVGAVSLENTHPFVHGGWIFAHNGTLQNFASGRERLLAAIPADLRRHIAGSTDSEHIFYFWLGKLRAALNNIEAPADVASLTRTLAETVRELHAWFPDHDGETTKLNFLLTDGRLLVATRWGHSLSMLQQGEEVLLASEPTCEGPWQEVPDRSLVVVDGDLNVHKQAIELT